MRVDTARRPTRLVTSSAGRRQCPERRRANSLMSWAAGDGTAPALAVRMRRWLGSTLLAVVLGLGLAALVHAADRAVEIPCGTKVGQRVAYKSSFMITDHTGASGPPGGQTNDFSYQVLAKVIEGRVTHANGTLSLSFVFTHQFEYLGAVPDDPRTASASGRYGIEEIYAPKFKQSIAFCGRRWVPGEMQTIELPFPRVDAVVVGRLLRVGRRYGRSAAEFSIEVSGRMPLPGKRTGEMAGSGHAWVDLATGITLESRIESEAIAYDTDLAPEYPFRVVEERRVDQQMSSF
jgi:hypothetical protein